MKAKPFRDRGGRKMLTIDKGPQDIHLHAIWVIEGVTDESPFHHLMWQKRPQEWYDAFMKNNPPGTYKIVEIDGMNNPVFERVHLDEFWSMGNDRS